MGINARPDKALREPIILCLGLCLFALAFSIFVSRAKSSDSEQVCRSFPQTGKTVCGDFLDYWQTHGGVAVQGYPISEEVQETSTDGHVNRVQYFEKAVFERRPEVPGDNKVLLEPLGSLRFAALYPQGAPASDWDHARDNQFFPETGYYIEEPFLTYWRENGGMDQFGNPISKPFREQSAANGKAFVVQYFERAEIELHPELPSAYQILPAALGTLRFAEVYPQGLPTATP